MFNRFRNTWYPAQRRRISLANPSQDVLFYDDFSDGIYLDKYILSNPSYPFTEDAVNKRIKAAWGAWDLWTIQQFYIDFPIYIKYQFYSGSGGATDTCVQAYNAVNTLFYYASAYGSQYNYFCSWDSSGKVNWAPSVAWHTAELFFDNGLQTLWVDGTKRMTRNYYNIFPITQFSIIAHSNDYIGAPLIIQRASGVRT